MGLALTCAKLQAQLVYDTAGMVLDRLEEVHSSISRVIWQERRNVDRREVLIRASEAAKTVLQITQTE